MKTRRSIGHRDEGEESQGGMGLFGLIVEVDGGAGF